MRRKPVPPGWKRTALDHVASVQTGIAKGKALDGETVNVPYLRVANVQDSHVDLSVIKEITLKPSEISRYSLRAGDVLFTEGGDFDKLGRGTVWIGEIQPCLHQNHVFAVRPKLDVLLPAFLAFQAASEYGRRFFQLSSKQSTNLASINSTQLKEFPVLLPPLPEQRKIAEILQTWDEAIEKLVALRAAKEQQFRGFQQKLIDPDFKSYGDTLEQYVLIPNFEKITSADGLKPLTVKLHCKGIMANGRNVQITLSDKGRPYYRRKSEDLLIGRQNFHNGGFGIVPSELDGFIASNAITSLRVDSSKADVHYLFYFFSRKDYYLRIGHIMDGTGQKELSDKQIRKLPVSIPSLEKQVEVVQILNAANAEISLIDTKIEALQRQKRGLMQKLLTGEWRVKVEGTA